MHNSQMWVCNVCGTAQWHPLIYCPHCPGRLRCERRNVPFPWTQFKTEEELNKYLESLGLKPTGK